MDRISHEGLSSLNNRIKGISLVVAESGWKVEHRKLKGETWGSSFIKC